MASQNTARIIGTAIFVAALLPAMAQTPARDVFARGKAAWDQRLANTAISQLEIAAKDPLTAAEAHELLGRIYTFKGWQQDNVFPGFHDEPAYRARAINELKASLAADPNRTSAREALETAEGFAAADRVDPAPPRPEIRALDQKINAGRDAKVPMGDVVASSAEMQRAMGFNDLPSTFYVDRGGVVRYQVLGFESHGDSDARVSWYVDQLKPTH